MKSARNFVCGQKVSTTKRELVRDYVPQEKTLTSPLFNDKGLLTGLNWRYREDDDIAKM